MVGQKAGIVSQNITGSQSEGILKHLIAEPSAQPDDTQRFIRGNMGGIFAFLR